MKKLDYDLLNDILFFGKKIIKILYIFIISIVVYILFRLLKETNTFSFILQILKIISPIFIGFIIAWILNPLVDKLQSKISNRIVCSIIVFVSFFLVIGIILYMLIPILYKQIIDFGSDLPGIIDLLNKKVPNINFNKYINDIKNRVPSMIMPLIKNMVSIVGTIGLSFIISLYLLIDYHCINSKIKKIVKKDDFISLLIGMNREVRKCVNGTLLVATMVFVLDTVFFSIFKLPGSFLFGLVCGLTDLIPYIGPYIGGIIAVLVGFSKSKCLGITISIIVICVQLLENIVLQPIVMSKAIKLHPVTIMMSLTIFGSLFGIIGMLIATPIVAMLKVVFVYLKNEKIYN